MKPDELRALADCLNDPNAMQRTARRKAADYLRACADAKPVGYVTANGLRSLRQDDATVLLYAHDYLIRPDHVALYTYPAPAAPHHAMLDSHRRLVEQAIQNTEHPSGMSTHDGKARIDASILRRMLAIIDSSPAAPQAEPCIGNDSACPCQDGDACHYKDAADGTKAWPVPQAEPKREPLSDDAISYEHACRSFYESACAASDFDSFKLGVRFAERAHRIGGSDE